MKIRFETLSLTNFAIFPALRIDFGTDESRPLTIIRGENNSGKTTMMRAFIWILYGERFVPAMTHASHPIRPPWSPANEDVISRGELRFVVGQEDGSLLTYKLVRSGRTSIRDGRIRYDNDSLSLYRSTPGSGFLPSDERIPALQKRYFPEGMRDFILIDADKAEDLVGGPEQSHDDNLMRRTTTVAVRSLLGLEPMKRVSERLRQIGDQKLSAAARESGDRDLVLLGQQESEAEERMQRQELKVSSVEAGVLELAADHRSQQRTRDSEFAQFEETHRIQEEIAAQRQAQAELKLARANEIAQLSDLMLSEQSVAVLLLPRLAELVDVLDPLKKDGRIPASELSLLPRLLRDGVCVCGVRFDSHPERRQEVELRLELSDPRRGEAEFGDLALEAARDLANRGVGPGTRGWLEGVDGHRAVLGDLDRKLASVDASIDSLETQMREEGRSASKGLELIVRNFEALTQTLSEREAALAIDRQLLEELRGERRSIAEKLRDAKTRTASLARAQDLSRVATDLAAVIDSARSRIETLQVQKLDEAVNELFMEVISAAETGHYQHVGIRAASGGDGQYEPYIVGPQGEEKPLAMANGASRRAVAAAMILALSKTTATSIPFVADSLLHSLSGSVKRKLVDYLTAGTHIGQPILFATRDDLLGLSAASDGSTVRDIVVARAGATYTVSGQGDVGGELCRPDPDATEHLQSVVCRCGPDEFCDICERRGDSVAAHLVHIPGVNR